MNEKMTIRTNWHYYFRLSWFDLPKKWQKEYEDITNKEECYFVIYKRWCYLEEFVIIPENLVKEFPILKEWEGILSDSFFSGIVCRYDSERDAYQMGTYSV